MKNQFTEISSTVEFNGITVRFDFFLQAWAQWGPNNLKEVGCKQYFYNTGPTGYDKKNGYKLSNYYSSERGEDAQIFTVWFRNDGCGIRVFKWMGSEAEFDAYKCECNTPYAIQKEWGIES